LSKILERTRKRAVIVTYYAIKCTEIVLWEPGNIAENVKEPGKFVKNLKETRRICKKNQKNPESL